MAQLSTIRHLEQEWEAYREVMRAESALYEHAAHDIGTKNYFVHKGLAARREVDAYVRQLASEMVELLEETAREVRLESEAELERLRAEKAGATWG
ncbi:hypothetical protein [Leifsonia shinshuensis]|uniref:Uncharacterized protein n=1 Tax=Leifsonia shinshuensis TaxID=150026 RepID=A0A7G6YFG5_9MICO|nr:hypothetical protein [Leifsonia shinshuensis]QNE37230.1 hypothetical protein F1C12_20330 [Leifsonia shinshuensis]